MTGLCDLQNPFDMLIEINEPSTTSQEDKNCVVIDIHPHNQAVGELT